MAPLSAQQSEIHLANLATTHRTQRFSLTGVLPAGCLCFSTETNLCQRRITVLQLRAPQSTPLCKEQADELAVRKEVAAPQPSRLLHQTVEPLQTISLNYGG